VLIPNSIARRLEVMCDGLDCPPPIITRVALTQAHIAEHNLPTRPTKRDGNTHAHGFEGDSVELDALPPRVLRNMVHKVIKQHISPRALRQLRVAEESERSILRMWAQQLSA